MAAIKSYSEKLKSPKWQKKRLEILERDKFTCVVCDDKDSMLHVHHVYEDYSIDPWEHENETLITLCQNCHESWHKIFNTKVDPYSIVKISKVWLNIENSLISKSINEISLKTNNNPF